MILKKINKKGGIGSGLAWVVAFLFVTLIMFFHVIFTLFIFADKEITGDVDVTFEGGSTDFNTNSKFLNFLNSKILVDGKQEKIIDSIRFSLEPYFEIENRDGKSFFDFKLLGMKALNDRDGSLNNKLISLRFGVEGWTKYSNAYAKFQEGERVNGIIKRLNLYDFCGKNERLGLDNKYFLEVPQGIIIKDGLRSPRVVRKDTGSILFIKHKTNYKGENVEIIFQCRKAI